MRKLETKTRSVGEIELRCTQFAASRQARLFARLLKMASPALRKLDGIKTANDLDKLGPAIAEVFQGIDEDSAWTLQLDLLKGTQAKVGDRMLALAGETEVDAAFGGDLKALWQAVAFSIEVNFGPLFDGVKGVIAAALAQPEPAPEKEAAA